MSKGERDFRALIAVGVVVVGLVLLLGWSALVAVVDRVSEDVAQRLTLPLLLGVGMVIGAGIFIGWRARVRFLKSSRWQATVCPRCGSPIRRVHRSPLDKVVSKVFLPHGGRYRCEKAECGWTGLRHIRRHGTATKD